MNKRGLFLVSLLFVAVLVGVVSASVSVGNPGYSLPKDYSPGQAITGWANVSVANEPFNSTIEETNSGKSISLQSILSKQSGFGYSCIPSGCTPRYLATGSGEKQVTFKLGAGQSKTVGILLNSQKSSTTVSSLSGFTMNVTSTAGNSSYPQLGITILNGSSPTWKPYKGSGTFTELQYACYTSGGASLHALTAGGYCVKFSEIPASPELSIGAYVNGSGTSKIAMSIWDASNLANKGSCNVTASGTGVQKISCTPKNEVGGGNFSISKAGSFYVCISSPTGSAGNYKINGTSSFDCGFAGSPPPESSQASAGFRIFAQWETFASIGSFILNDTSIQEAGNPGYNASVNISNYIQSNYGNDCSSGCLVPITFTANQTQNITLSDFNLNYEYGGLETSTSSLYNATQAPASFSTNGYQKLVLSGANFTAANSVGNHSFDLVFNNGTHKYNLVSTEYSILNVPQSISIFPQVVAALDPTKFTATVSVPAGGTANITSYRWDFGDGSAVQTTSSNSISHKYDSVGVFNMTINVTNSAGLNSSKMVQISVLPPKEAVTQVLAQKLGALKNLKSEIANFSSAFARDSLTSILNLDQKTTLLNNLTSANTNAGSSGASNQQYVNILNELNSINLPASVQETQRSSGLFVPSQSNIDLEALKNIGGGSYDSSNESGDKSAILSWDVANIKSKVDFSEFSTVTGNNSQVLLDVVTVDVGANPSGGNAYLIIPKMYNMTLGQKYLSSGNYYYATLGNSPQTVEFATTQPLSPVNLPIFIAPSLTQISVSGNQEVSNNNQIDKWLILVGILGGIFLVAFIIYVILGKWYQNRYESYLFKNKNDLYNVVNYIHSAKMNGVKNSEIEKNLRRSTWTSEQISYVMKKYAGKGVGLPGFVKRVKIAKRSGRMH